MPCIFISRIHNSLLQITCSSPDLSPLSAGKDQDAEEGLREIDLYKVSLTLQLMPGHTGCLVAQQLLLA